MQDFIYARNLYEDSWTWKSWLIGNRNHLLERSGDMYTLIGDTHRYLNKKIAIKAYSLAADVYSEISLSALFDCNLKRYIIRRKIIRCTELIDLLMKQVDTELKVYSDSQNSHHSAIVEAIRDSILRLMEEEVVDYSL
jgi:hypothetical protein